MMIPYTQLSKLEILKRRVLLCATQTTVVHVEASVIDRYIRNQEKRWVAIGKWLLNRMTK